MSPQEVPYPNSTSDSQRILLLNGFLIEVTKVVSSEIVCTQVSFMPIYQWDSITIHQKSYITMNQDIQTSSFFSVAYESSTDGFKFGASAASRRRLNVNMPVNFVNTPAHFEAFRVADSFWLSKKTFPNWRRYRWVCYLDRAIVRAFLYPTSVSNVAVFFL